VLTGTVLVASVTGARVTTVAAVRRDSVAFEREIARMNCPLLGIGAVRAQDGPVLLRGNLTFLLLLVTSRSMTSH
jgi:hypothetical protein